MVFHSGYQQLDLEEVGDLGEGAYSVEPRPEPTEGKNEFEQVFNETFEGGEDVIAAEMYDAVFLTVLTLQRAGEVSGTAIADHIKLVSSDPGERVTVGEFDDAKAILEEAEPIRRYADAEPVHYVGAFGHVDLNEALEPLYPQAVMQIQGGEPTDIEILPEQYFEKLVVLL